MTISYTQREKLIPNKQEEKKLLKDQGEETAENT